MTAPLLIPCPHCNGLNRIPAERLGDHPKCGRCKGEVLLSKPFELKQGDYASQIKGDLPLLVDVWADWCGPCKSFAPVFEQAASQLAGGLFEGRGEALARPTPVGPDIQQQRQVALDLGGVIAFAQLERGAQQHILFAAAAFRAVAQAVGGDAVEAVAVGAGDNQGCSHE